MQPKVPKLLEDIRDAAAFIGEVMRGKTLGDFERTRPPVLLAEVEALLRAAP